jgi:hypothetical protein
MAYNILERFAGPRVEHDDTPWMRDHDGEVEWRPEVRAVLMDDVNGTADPAARVARIRSSAARSRRFLVLIRRRPDEDTSDLPPETFVTHYTGENMLMPSWIP